MPHTERCIRCGRHVRVESAEFIDWETATDGSVICPGCLTPSDRPQDDGSLQTEGADEKILRDLDPDNDDNR